MRDHIPTQEEELWTLLARLTPQDALTVLGDYGANAVAEWDIGREVDWQNVLTEAYEACVDNLADCRVDGISGRIETYIERAETMLSGTN